jgi:hypothetical protein
VREGGREGRREGGRKGGEEGGGKRQSRHIRVIHRSFMDDKTFLILSLLTFPHLLSSCLFGSSLSPPASLSLISQPTTGF